MNYDQILDFSPKKDMEKFKRVSQIENLPEIKTMLSASETVGNSSISNVARSTMARPSRVKAMYSLPYDEKLSPLQSKSQVKKGWCISQDEAKLLFKHIKQRKNREKVNQILMNLVDMRQRGSH